MPDGSATNRGWLAIAKYIIRWVGGTPAGREILDARINLFENRYPQQNFLAHLLTSPGDLERRTTLRINGQLASCPHLVQIVLLSWRPMSAVCLGRRYLVNQLRYSAWAHQPSAQLALYRPWD